MATIYALPEKAGPYLRKSHYCAMATESHAAAPAVYPPLLRYVDSNGLPGNRLSADSANSSGAPPNVGRDGGFGRKHYHAPMRRRAMRRRNSARSARQAIPDAARHKDPRHLYDYIFPESTPCHISRGSLSEVVDAYCARAPIFAKIRPAPDRPPRHVHRVAPA